mgnify:CR=1 FL=1
METTRTETNKKEIMDTMMKRMKEKIKFKKCKMTSQRQSSCGPSSKAQSAI